MIDNIILLYPLSGTNHHTSAINHDDILYDIVAETVENFGMLKIEISKIITE